MNKSLNKNWLLYAVVGMLSLTLLSACSNLFGPLNNSADHFSAEVLWTRAAEDIQEYGFEIIDDGFSPTLGSLLHIAANPAAESTDDSDAVFIAYSWATNNINSVSARFETLTNAYAGPDIYVRDLIVDDGGNAYVVGFDPIDDLQKIYSLDYSDGSSSLISTVPVDTPWRVINPNAGAAISGDGLSIFVSIPTEFVILEYAMSSPGDTGGSWSVIAGTEGSQGTVDSTENTPATEALLAGPFAIAVEQDGLLFFDSAITFLDGDFNYARPDIPRLRRIDSDGMISTFSDIPVLDDVSLPYVEVYYSAYRYSVSDGYLSVDNEHNILFGNIDEVIRIENRNGKATVISGEVDKRFDFTNPLSDWTTEPGLLAERAFDVDLRFIMDIMPLPDGSIIVSQGGYGNLQGIRILRLFQD